MDMNVADEVFELLDSFNRMKVLPMTLTLREEDSEALKRELDSSTWSNTDPSPRWVRRETLRPWVLTYDGPGGDAYKVRLFPVRWSGEAPRFRCSVAVL